MGNGLWDWEGDNDEGGVDFYGIRKETVMKGEWIMGLGVR